MKAPRKRHFIHAATPPKEGADQAAFVTWFRRQFPKVIIHSIPNGTWLQGDAALRAKLMNKLKAEGLVPAYPDLEVSSWRLCIEFKRLKRGVLSEEQELLHEVLRAEGTTVLVPRGYDEAVAMVRAFRGMAPNPPSHQPLLPFAPAKKPPRSTPERGDSRD